MQHDPAQPRPVAGSLPIDLHGFPRHLALWSGLGCFIRTSHDRRMWAAIVSVARRATASRSSGVPFGSNPVCRTASLTMCIKSGGAASIPIYQHGNGGRTRARLPHPQGLIRPSRLGERGAPTRRRDPGRSHTPKPPSGEYAPLPSRQCRPHRNSGGSRRPTRRRPWRGRYRCRQR